MHPFIRTRGAAACAVAALLASGPGVLAASAPAVAAEAQGASAALAHELMGPLDFRGVVLKAVDVTDFGAQGNAPPEWRDMLRTAALQEYDLREPAVEGVIAARISSLLAPDEQAAGLRLLRGPDGADVRKLLADLDTAETAQRQAAKLRLKAAWARTPAEKGFLDKIQSLLPLPQADSDQVFVVMMPGICRRFGAALQESGRESAPAGPRTEAETAAAELIHVLLGARLDAFLDKDLNSLDLFKEHGVPQTWRDLMRTSAHDAALKVFAEFEPEIGKPVAQVMTAGEIRAGVAFLRSSEGQAFLAYSAAHKDDSAKLPDDVAAAVRAAAQTPEGKGFFLKLGPAMQGVQMGGDSPLARKFVAHFAAATLIEFGQLAEADGHR